MRRNFKAEEVSVLCGLLELIESMLILRLEVKKMEFR